MTSAGSIYIGNVVHKRLRPRQHALSYRVFSLLTDVDRIEALSERLRLFSYNSANLCALYDRDFGPGDGTPICMHARRSFEAAGFKTAGRRILLLAYPRVAGYAFNPLSVYFLMSECGGLVALNYEVSNTFAERKGYVVAAGAQGTGGVYAQRCRKELFVSPFAARSGRYSFRVVAPAEAITVGVAYDDGQGPLIKTHFRGTQQSLSDVALAAAMIRMPLMTLKVTGAIHYEAMKLWLKGIPLVAGHTSPRYSASYGGSVQGRAPTGDGENEI
ncbi:MAG: hypothetical protein APF80_03790 [Alphaproteobacteria bacterium BRH_c36]|nr:MAG: hypothetical protein APF80_03790 [Alphaproteobacteria bacterium BRH_c36]